MDNEATEVQIVRRGDGPVKLANEASLSGPLADAWGCEHDGRRHLDALGTWLTRYTSENTRKSYSQSVMMFLWWLELRHGRMLLPSEVTRADAVAFCQDQVKMPDDWASHRRRRSAPPDCLRFLDVVERRPGCSVLDVSGDTGDSLSVCHDGLMKLVHQNFVIRSPRVREIRPINGDVVGIAVTNMKAFRYWAKPVVKSGPGTMGARISALSSYWSYLANTGENTGERPLLVHNIWSDLIRRFARNVSSERTVSRALKTPDEELFLRLLAVTFSGWGERAMKAAVAYWNGEDPGPPDTPPSIMDLRDRAVLIWMVGLGLRVAEASALRGSSIGTGGLVKVEGKGGKSRVVQAPDVCIRALSDFRAHLSSWSKKSKKRRTQDRSRLMSESSPLFPAVGRWGNKAAPDMADRGVTPSGISAILHRLSTKAGLSGADATRAHPHGLRHLGAHLAVDAGVPLPIIQKALGHSSLAITSIYVEEHDVSKVCLRPKKAAVD